MMKSIMELVSRPYERKFIRKCEVCGDDIYHCTNPELGIDFYTQCQCEFEKQQEAHEIELRRKLLTKTYDQRLANSNMSAKMIELAKKKFETNQNNIKAYNLIDSYCDKFDKTYSLGIFLSGPCGVGKTHLIAWCVNRLLLKGEEVYFTNVNEMFDKIKKSYNAEIPYDFERYIKQVQVLVMDDLGAEYMKEYDAKKLFEIIDTRNRSGLQTLYTSNLTVEGLREKYSNGSKGLSSVDADRIVSRILGACESASINDYDHRIEAFMERKKNV